MGMVLVAATAADGRRSECAQDRRVQLDEFSCETRKRIGISACRTNLEYDVPSLDVSSFTQLLAQDGDRLRIHAGREGGSDQHAHDGNFSRLLCVGARRRERAQQDRDECTPMHHRITRSNVID